MLTAQRFHFAVGAELPNGAEIREFRTHPNGGLVVLAYWEGDTQPWVTWRVDASGDCVWGHYFFPDQEAEARGDYATR